jgi:peroxisomal 3,2-trans-enoyl-CoA isomerase
MAEENVISVEYRGRVAIVTIDNAKKLNSLSQQQYYTLAQLMREIATHDEVYITVLIGKGRYFSAYVSHQHWTLAPDAGFLPIRGSCFQRWTY